MAKLMMTGPVADVEITEDYDDEDTPIVLTCVKHPTAWRAGLGPCGQTARASSYNDAVNWAFSHAENGAPLS